MDFLTFTQELKAFSSIPTDVLDRARSIAETLTDEGRGALLVEMRQSDEEFQKNEDEQALIVADMESILSEVAHTFQRIERTEHEGADRDNDSKKADDILTNL